MMSPSSISTAFLAPQLRAALLLDPAILTTSYRTTYRNVTRDKPPSHHLQPFRRLEPVEPRWSTLRKSLDFPLRLLNTSDTLTFPGCGTTLTTTQSQDSRGCHALDAVPNLPTQLAKHFRRKTSEQGHAHHVFQYCEPSARHILAISNIVAASVVDLGLDRP